MEKEAQPEMKITVCRNANNSLDNIADYIALDSLFQAKRVHAEILNLIGTLNLHPYAYPECPELPTKNHIYRKAIYTATYKIIYRIVKDEIWVLDIFHASAALFNLKITESKTSPKNPRPA